MQTVTNTFYFKSDTRSAEVPQHCPYCGSKTHSTHVASVTLDYDSVDEYVSIAWLADCCSRVYIVNYLFNISSKALEFISHYPAQDPGPMPENMADISPRFVTLYSQARTAEGHEHYELAACGYRNALEVLIKDFAINVLNENRKEVEGKSLFNAIEDYLPKELMNTSDVVRILGNDNTHYLRRYEDIDFAELKNYLDIFMMQIEVQYKILNPPVSRN